MTKAAPAKMTASKVSTAMPQLMQQVAELEERVNHLEKQAEGDRDELLRRDAWIQLCLTAVQTLLRWHYRCAKKAGHEKSMVQIKQLGEAVNEALEQVEPDF